MHSNMRKPKSRQMTVYSTQSSPLFYPMQVTPVTIVSKHMCNVNKKFLIFFSIFMTGMDLIHRCFKDRGERIAVDIFNTGVCALTEKQSPRVIAGAEAAARTMAAAFMQKQS